MVGRNPKVKPNVSRQMILVGLALFGIAIGYGLGFVFKKDAPAPEPDTVSAAPQEPLRPPAATDPLNPAIPETALILPESNGTGGQGRIRAYEEALPGNIIEAQIPPLAPLDPILPPSPLGETFPGSAPETDPVAGQVPQDVSPETEVRKPDERSRQPEQPRQIPATWQKNAVPATPDGRPMIAIVIDDMGIDRRRSDLTVSLTPPLTLSYLTYGRDLNAQTSLARGAGHELMMHIPMEPSSVRIDPGPNVLLSGMEKEELISNLRWGLDQFDGFVGINNHMGSRFTSDYQGMLHVMTELNRRGLIFLDSLTSAGSQGSRAAREKGTPHLVRNVFLDHVDDYDAINRRLEETERLAVKQGHAIAIGHPRDNTLDALDPWLRSLPGKGLQLVPLTALLKGARKSAAKAD